MMTDIEIAQQCRMHPIADIAATAGIDESYLEQYGRYKAKIDPQLLKDRAERPGQALRIVCKLQLQLMRDAVADEAPAVIAVPVTVALIYRIDVEARGLQIVLGKTDAGDRGAQLRKLRRSRAHGLLIDRIGRFQAQRHRDLIRFQA